MTILARASDSNYTPAPNNVYPAVCCDVIDLGNIKSEWQGKTREQHKIRVVFQIDLENEEKKRFIVSQQFTLSLSEKANLRKFLESWRGIAFTPDELKDGFDVEKLLGAPATIQTVQATRGDKTYANIQTIMRLVKGMPKLEVKDYVRVKDRTDGQQPNGEEPPPPDDDDLPF